MNDLEELFNRQPPYSESDRARVITHYREQRAQYAGGIRPKKDSGPKAAAVDMVALGLSKPKVVQGITLGKKT